MDPTCGWVKRSKFNFSEQGHVTYQIEENRECSNILSNILPIDPPTLGMESVGQNLVTLHIKLNYLMQQHGSKYFACRPPTPPPLTLGMGSVDQNFSFFSFTYLFTLKEMLRGIPTPFHIWLNILETVDFQGMY